MKKLMPSHSSDTIVSVFDDDNITLLHFKDAANRINDYFGNISTKLDSKFGPLSNNNIYQSENSEYKLSHCDEITIEELTSELKKIDITKSS